MSGPMSARARTLGRMRTVPPTSSGPNIWRMDGSKPNDVVAATSAVSAGRNAVRDQPSRLASARCGTRTPFGAPVDPEVNIT
jgi:hypothetical protein